MKYWYEAKGKIQKKIFAAASLLLVSALLLGSVSYAWLSLSARPEVASVATNIASNGSLEIALGKDIRESAVGDSFDTADATIANRTWGNLIDLTDKSYGLQSITLRPAMLNSAGGAVNTLHPFAHPVYGTDGRVEKIYANDVFAAPYNGSRFVTAVNEYGVRGIGATAYAAAGVDGTFGPLSQRQEHYYDAHDQLRYMMKSSYISLCNNTQKVLVAYCQDGTGVSAADFNLDAFSGYVENMVSAANEELRLNFTLLAAAEPTSADNYFAAMELLEEMYPSYETIQPLLESSIRTMADATKVSAAIAELRTFQNVAAQLRDVIASGGIDGSDGYSMEEIAQTVGLIFNLEKTGFSTGTYVYEGTTGDGTPYTNTYTYFDSNYYSNVISELYYYDSDYDLVDGLSDYDKSWWYSESSYVGSSVNDLTSVFYSSDVRNEYQDNDSREYIADYIENSCLEPIYNSLPLGKLDRAIAELYVSHWSYWDTHKDEVEALSGQIKELEDTLAEKQPEEVTESPDTAELQSQLAEKQNQLQRLSDAEIYALNDERLESIRSAMTETIEALRQYTLWSIAYFACDGQVPDDAYHRMREIAESSVYMHPRTAYQALCNYGVAPVEELTQMVEAYENLERELRFLPTESLDAETIRWSELNAELRRCFGSITHKIKFSVGMYQDSHWASSYYNEYSPEDTVMPTDAMTRIREEIEKCDTAVDASVSMCSHTISYGGESFWAQAVGLLLPNRGYYYSDRHLSISRTSEYVLEERQFTTTHSAEYTEGFWFDISVGVGSEDNFNESGLTVRQTRFREAQENISYQQSLLITAAVDAEKDMVSLLMDMIAGQSSVSLTAISDYLSALQRQLRYADEMMYQAVLTLAASDYANDGFYNYAYSSYAPKDAADLIQELRWYYDVDETVLTALNQRMALLESQEALLDQSLARLRNYQDPQTGALTAEQISADEAADLLDPVLDTSAMFLYGYVKDPQSPKDSPSYLHTILYEGYGSPAVQISGRQATIAGREPVTLFGDAYLSLGRSLSGALLALAKNQVETYAPPSGGLDAAGITELENGMNRKAYAMGSDKAMYTLELYTADTLYALPTNLWTYTGNTAYIAADKVLMDLYGYCVDLSLRTNAAASDLLLQTEAINRIYDEEETKTDTAMGAGSFMEFTTMHPSYSLDMAREYMSCIRVAITDTNTGYIYGYAALDMDAAEELGITIKAPLRLYHYDGTLVEGSQYLCHMDQNLEKNLTVYVYLDGAKTSEEIVSAYDKQSLYGVMNLQFASSADLNPAVMDKLR